MGKEVKHRVTVDTEQAKRSLAGLKDEFRKTGDAADGLGGKGGAKSGGGLAGLKDGLRQAATGSTSLGGVMATAAKAATGFGAVLIGLRVAMQALGAAAREVGRWIGEAVNFQKQTFQLRTLTGSMAEARNVMLQLTEGKQAVDHVFGSQAVVDAYRKLHVYTNGALASASVVKLLGDAAARTGNDLGSMADALGRTWQMITAGEDLGRVGFPLMNMGLVDREFINQLQRMKAEGADAADIFMALYRQIREVHQGGVQGLAGSIDDLRNRNKDLAQTIRTELGEAFAPAVAGWERLKNKILSGIQEITNNPIRLGVHIADIPNKLMGLPGISDLYRGAEGIKRRMTGTGFFASKDRKPDEITDEQFLAMSAEEQEAVISSSRARGGSAEASDRFIELQARQAADRRRAEQVNDFQSGVAARDEEKRLAGLSSADLRAEAEAVKDKDQLKHLQLLDRAGLKATEEREAETEAARKLAAAEEALAAQIETATRENALRQMDPAERAKHLGRMAAGEMESAARQREYARSGINADGNLRAQEHELRAIQYTERARQATEEDQRQKDAEAERKRNDAERYSGERDRFAKDREEFELSKRPLAEQIAEREKRLEQKKAMRSGLSWDAAPESRLKLEQDILKDEKDLERLKSSKPGGSAGRRGVEEFAEDLQRESGLTGRGRRIRKGDARAVADDFQKNLAAGAMNADDMNKGLSASGGDDLLRVQIALDNERNKLLRAQLDKIGMTP